MIGSEKSWSMGVVKILVVAQEKDDYIGSDHRLVYIEMAVDVHMECKSVRKEYWKLKELKERMSKSKGDVEKEMAQNIRVHMKSWKEKVLDDESVHMDVGDVYMEWKNRFEFIAKKVVGMKSRCVRKGVKKLPKFVKRLYEIRNTLRKEAEAEGDKKLFQLADDVSQKIKKICIEGNKKRWDSFCAEVCMEKLGARDFFSALHRVMGSKSTEVCGIRNLEGEIVNNGSEVRETWKEFFENLGRDGVNEGQFDEEFRVLMDAKVMQMEVDGGDLYQVELDYPISVSEVSE